MLIWRLVFLGGCKHAVALLFWLHRRSEEPPTTSTVCYWKKSELSKVGDNDKDFEAIMNITDKTCFDAQDNAVVIDFINNMPTASGTIFGFFRAGALDKLNLHHLSLKYLQDVSTSDRSAEGFIDFCSSMMSEDICTEMETLTRDQSECKEWHEMRFARITASKLFEASKCKTVEGSLTEVIMGSAGPLKTEAVLRGKRLETAVIKQVEKLRNIHICKAGFFCKPEYPIFGASPDGLSTEFCIEVKCPRECKSVKNYVENGTIKDKYLCQLQMQMFFCDKRKGLFCIAHPNFENNSEVDIYEISANVTYIKNYMSAALDFWKTAIYPLLVKW